MKTTNKSFFNKLYGRICSIWFITLLVTFKILLFPLYYFLLSKRSRRNDDRAHSLNNLWARLIVFSSGIRIEVQGLENLQPGQTYVFLPNHNSYLDIPVCNMILPGSFRFIGKKELAKVPLFGWMFERLHITINRSSHMDSYRSMIRAGKKLDEGISILIFPEGTIAHGKKVLSKFKDGAFKLACDKKIPLVPVSLIHTDRVIPDDSSFRIYPGKVKIIIHPPVPVFQDNKLTELPELRDQVYHTLYQSLAPYYA